jgi:hypothetical protein
VKQSEEHDSVLRTTFSMNIRMSSTTKVLVVVLLVNAVLQIIREIRMVPSLDPSAHSAGAPASEVVSSTSSPQQDQHHLDPSHVRHSDSTISSFNNKIFDSIVNQTNQVFMTMPAKAAGTTMKSFTQKCVNATKITNKYNIITDHYKVPSIFQVWLKSDTTFIDLVKGSTRETLILYLHREELSRVGSAIQHVLVNQICGGISTNGIRRGIALKTKYEFDVEWRQNRCIVHEEHLVRVIKGRENEIGHGSNELMTCNFFDGIAQNTPSNLVFVHYKQADKLQQILAKHHCPHILKDLPIAENVAASKKIEPFIRLKTNSSTEVTFKEWFDNKKNVILWALDLKSNVDCQSKIMDMEDHLFSCPDEAVTLFHGEYQCVSLS